MKLGNPIMPTNPSVEEATDWAELVALKRGSVARGKLSTEVSRAGGNELLVTDAWVELRERAGLSGHDWTFTIDDARLTRSNEDADRNILPAFLAALVLRVNIENHHRALFEQCVTEIVRGILPESLRIGHPRRPPVPSSFRVAFKSYVDQVDEAVVSLPPSTDNDLKMDVLAWRKFGDARGGYLHLVGQCATGADWEEKLNELDLDVIKDHVNWGVDPVRFFATPYVVASQHMRRTTKKAGLVLDRPRLLELERSAKLDPDTRDELRSVLNDLY
jgi:hypothetical protein